MPASTAPSGSIRSLLLLDVDGPLNPYRLITKKGFLDAKLRPGERRYRYERHEMRPVGWTGVEPCPVLLAPEHGVELRRLAEAYDLVWATTWQQSANTHIAPVLGLPELPVIRLPWSETKHWSRHARHTGSSKTGIIAGWLDTYAPGRPWVWIDDEITRTDREWFYRHYGDQRGGQQTVDRWLLDIHPSHGLREHDFEMLHAWAAALPMRDQAPAPRQCTLPHHYHIDYPAMEALYEHTERDLEAEQ